MSGNTNLVNEAGKEPVAALLTLLQDEDDKVASLAMEQFLDRGLAESAIAEFQEAHDPKLRQRIHQLGTILSRRRARQEFLDAVSQERISLWDGVVAINSLYDPQCNRQKVNDELHVMVSRLGLRRATAAKTAALMREQEFCVPEEDVLDVDLYLIERVLETCYGSPAVLCALAHQAGLEAGWESSIVLHEGRFCLLDRHHLLIDPTAGWHVTHLSENTKFHPCSRKDLWLGILSQLFLVSLVDGHLRDLYHFGDLLSALNEMPPEDALPYPLGKAKE
jgi:hypothetical protein